MAAGLEVDAAAIPQLVAGLLMLAVAGWLLILDFEKRLYRALALLLVVRGMLNLVLVPAISAGDPEYWERVVPYFIIGAPFALLHFALRYRQGLEGVGAPRWAGWAILGALIAAETAYLLDHDLLQYNGLRGPLALLSGLNYLLYAGVGWLLARDAREAADTARRRSLRLVSLAFLLLPIFASLHHVVGYAVAGIQLATGTREPQSTIANAWNVASDPAGAYNHFFLLAILVPACHVASMHIRDLAGPRGRDARSSLIAIGAAAASGLLPSIVFYGSLWPDLAADPNLPPHKLAFGRMWDVYTPIDMLWTLAFVALLAYSFIRYSVFGMRSSTGRTLGAGFGAAAAVALLFVVMESGASLVGGEDPLLGIAIVGIVLVLLSPLRGAVAGLFDRLSPRGKDLLEMTDDERADVYREMLQVAWLDGQMTVKDRRLLESARARLAIHGDEAEAMEREVTRGASGSVAAGGRRRGAAAARAGR